MSELSEPKRYRDGSLHYIGAHECILDRTHTHTHTYERLNSNSHTTQPHDRSDFRVGSARSREISDNDAGKRKENSKKEKNKKHAPKNARASRECARQIAQITHETILMKPARHKGLQIQSPRKREMTRRRAFVITTNLQA